MGAKARMGGLHACCGQIAAPVPFIGLLCYMRPYGVQDNVPGYFEEMGVFLYENSLVSSLKEVAGPVVPFIESLGIYTVHLPHAD